MENLMKLAFEINLNGNVICVAGGSEIDLVLAVLRLCQPGSNTASDNIEILGQAGKNHEIWSKVPIQLNDVVVIRVVDAETYQQTPEDERLDESELPAEEIGEYCPTCIALPHVEAEGM
jgi:hypothetical protein